MRRLSVLVISDLNDRPEQPLGRGCALSRLGAELDEEATAKLSRWWNAHSSPKETHV